jgi:hypothetical protein
MNVNINIDLEEFARDICNELNEDTLFKLIKDIDMGIASWNFTRRLHEYFDDEIKKDLIGE